MNDKLLFLQFVRTIVLVMASAARLQNAAYVPVSGLKIFFEPILENKRATAVRQI
jgi:hypothetical protein